jgi:hypothetical protein
VTVIDQAFRDAHPISASQVETLRLCARKWGLDKLDGVPRPANKYAQRGTDAHLVLEEWQRDGKIIDFDSDIGKIVSAGLRFLPRPGTLLTEYNFKFRTGTATYHGKMDLKGGGASPIREIWDHKTSTDLRYMKTPEKLRSDPQANIYAMSEIEEAALANQRIERIEQNWVYYLADPKKPKSRKVQLHVLPDKDTRIPVCPDDVKKEHFGIMYYDELHERFAEIEKDAKKILQYHLLHEQKQITGATLPYDVSACDAYGGCPYRDKSCKLSVSERIESMEAKLSLADKIKARLSGGSNGAAAASTANAPTTASTQKPSASARAAADAIKAGAVEPPATNPPEQVKGVDPDATPAASGPRVVVSSGDRMEMTARMAEGLLGSPSAVDFEVVRSPQKLAKLAVEYADAVLAELSKPRK